MLSPEAQNLTPPAGELIPDFQFYRERAHQERSKAINIAMSLLWSRMTRRQKRKTRDAAFWAA